MRIFLNPGHGGNDPGAVSKSGTKESIIAAQICKILEDRLKLNGYSVVVYQQKNSYFEISKEENKSKSDLFISVHCNSCANSTANGVECLYYPTSSKGKKIAEIMQNELVKATKLRNRGIVARSDLHVLKRTAAPAVLIECAFLSNEKEEALLKNQPGIFAAAIWEGIKKVKDLK